jgi:hypothetical protein
MTAFECERIDKFTVLGLVSQSDLGLQLIVSNACREPENRRAAFDIPVESRVQIKHCFVVPDEGPDGKDGRFSSTSHLRRP